MNTPWRFDRICEPKLGDKRDYRTTPDPADVQLHQRMLDLEEERELRELLREVWE